MLERTTASDTAAERSDRPLVAPGDSTCALPHAQQHTIAFATIYAQYRPAIFAYFYQRVRDYHDAEDLTALTFSEALRTSARYTEQGTFAAWLWSIARHKLQDAQRRQHQTVPLEQVASQLIDTTPSPEVHALRVEHRELVHTLLRALPDDQQTVLRLRYFGDWSFVDIAGHLDRSVGAVKMLVQRALATLRARHLQLEQRQPDRVTGAPGAARNLQENTLTFRLVRATLPIMSGLVATWHQALRPQPVLHLQPIRCAFPVQERWVHRDLRRRGPFQAW